MPASEQLAARIRGLPVIRCRAVLYLTATHDDAAAAAVGHSLDLLNGGGITPEPVAARAAVLADQLTALVAEAGGGCDCGECDTDRHILAFLRDLAGQCRDCGALLPGHALTCPRHVTQAVTE